MEGMVRFRSGLVTLSILVPVLAGACTSTPPTTAAETAEPAAAPPTTARHGEHAPTPATAPATLSPTELRARFSQHLGEHTLLAVRVTRSMVTAAPELRRVATAALQRNTDELTRTVASAFGGAQAGRFKQVWQRHVTDLESYATGVAGDDEAARQAARSALMADADAYGAWMAAASAGRLAAGDATADVRAHVERLMRQVDAYAARDYRQAYRVEREAYEHMFTTGTTMARASVTPRLAAGLDAPTAKLRSAFAMLLGEHMQLIVDAQRAAFAESEEFTAAAAQVNANSSALTRAMGAILGPERATDFQHGWADHVEGLMAYTAAVVGGDAAGRAAARRKLGEYAGNLARYFDMVLPKQVNVVAFTGAITTHDAHLAAHVDAYAARNYGEAVRRELEGYRHMLGLSDTAVDAIQGSMRSGMPVGGSRTGGGGTARPAR
jgi:hypothetical protein